VQDSKIDVIANDSGDRVTPAVVAFNESETVSVICKLHSCPQPKAVML
jgi:molecular chaperone DnaK (HSP70)